MAGIQGTGERKPHCSPPPARVAHTSREPYGTAKRGERQPCALQLCCSHYKHTIFLANDPSQALPKSAGRCLDTRLAPAAGQHHGEGALELLGLLRCPPHFTQCTRALWRRVDERIGEGTLLWDLHGSLRASRGGTGVDRHVDALNAHYMR